MDTPHTPASIRTALGLTQAEVAAKAGVSADTVARLELGRGVRAEAHRSIARVLGVTTDVLHEAVDVLRARDAAKGAA